MARYTFGPFLLDCEARTLLRGGDPVALTGETFDTLLLLVKNRGRLVKKDELLGTVWLGAVVEEANLTQTIFSLRKLLGDRPKDHRFIATVPGCGYQFVAQVTECPLRSNRNRRKPIHSGSAQRLPGGGLLCYC